MGWHVKWIIFAILSSIITFFWFGDMQISIVIGFAMILNLLIAGILGTLIPLTLEKHKIDPATSSPIILTTATDVIGFLLFLAWQLGLFCKYKNDYTSKKISSRNKFNK